jgi:hypothetical protein
MEVARILPRISSRNREEMAAFKLTDQNGKR